MTTAQYNEALMKLETSTTVEELEPLYALVEAGGAHTEELAEQLDMRRHELEPGKDPDDDPMDLGEPPTLSEAARQELREIAESQGLTLPDYY